MSKQADFDSYMEELLEQFPMSRQAIMIAWFTFYDVHGWDGAKDIIGKYTAVGYKPTKRMEDWL